MRYSQRLRYLLLAIASILCHPIFSQTSLPLNTIVTENFNSIGSSATATLPTGWRMSPSGNSVGTWAAGVSTTTQASSSGLPSTGGRYNWATTAGTDRAIGFLTDGSYSTPNALMAYYRNTTGSSVNSVTVAFAIERYVVNSGAFNLGFESSTDGTTWTAQPDGAISAGVFAAGANAGTFNAPKTINKMATINVTIPDNGDIYFRWVFNTTNSNSQGLALDNVSVFAGAATPVLIATLKDILQTDGGTPNQFNEGDVIRYETKIKNIGTGDAENVQINIPPPSNTTLVPGSIKTSAVAVDDNYTTSFNTALNAGSVLTNDFGVPAPTAVLSYGPTANSAATAPGIAGTTDAGGTITLAANGTFSYTPPSGFSGVDKFAYVTGNGNLPNNDAIVSITVSPDLTFTTTNVDPTCNGGTNGSITFNASGGNGTLTYSITGSAGTYQSSNVFSGLAANTYNVAVKDAIGTIKTNTVTLNNPAAIVVSGTIPALTYNTAMSAATFTKTGGTGTIVWSATGLPTGISINSSTGAVTGTPTQTGAFNAVITATDANSCTGSGNVSFNVAPNMASDAYAAVVGNTQLVADAHSTPTTPYTTNNTNILVNDQSDAAITVTAVNEAATTAGGIITIGTDGKFIYTPPAGTTGADSYTYTGTSNGVSATATINLTIGNMVWYVDNSYGGSNGAASGRSNTPFTTVNAATTAAAINQVIYIHTGSGNTPGNATLKSGQTLRGAGAALTVGALSITAGTRPTLSGNIALANNVTADGFNMNTGTTTALTGSSATGVSVTINSITTSGAVNAVSLTGTTGTVTIAGGTQTNSTGATFNISGGSVALTYSGGNTQGANAAMVSVAGGHTGTLTFNTGTLSATNGTGLQFDNADGTYNFSGTTTLNGGDAGIDILNGSGGTFSFNSNTAITNPSGIAININASTANVTYSGSFSKTNNAITGISVTNNTGGTIAINGTGTKTLSTTTANAINLTSNTGATINFSGNNLLLTTTSGIGFNATGGGTVSVAGTGNIITSTTGTALNVVSTTIGGTGLTFRSITSNGGSNHGIILNTTGSLGGLSITGNGAAGTGGTIANKTGADGSTTLGTGIYLINTSHVSLSWMQMNDCQNFGIRGFSVNNFTLTESNLTGVFGTNYVGGFVESAIHFGTQGNDGTGNGLTGTAIFTGNNIGGGFTDNLGIFNNNTGSLNVTITDGINPAIFSHNATTNNTGNDAVLIETRGNGGALGAGFNLTFSATSVEFKGARGDNIQLIAASNSTHNITVLNNTFHNTHPQIVTGGGGMALNGGGSGSNYVVNYNIEGNSFRGAKSSPLHFGYGGTAGTVRGTVLNNIIGVDDAGSPEASTVQATTGASDNGNGINIYHEKIAGNGSLTHATRIQGNQVRDVTGIPIFLRSNAPGTSGTGRLEATILNNIVEEVKTGNGINTAGTFSAIYTQLGGTGSPDAGKMGLNIRGNTLKMNNNGGVTGGENNAITIDQSSPESVYYFPGYTGGELDGIALSNFLVGSPNSNIMTNGQNPSEPGGFVYLNAYAKNQPFVLLPVPLYAAHSPATVNTGSVVSKAALDNLLKAALKRFENSGVSKEDMEILKTVQVNISDMPVLFLGSSTPGNISIDADAAGFEWFVDETPFDDEEFNGSGKSIDLSKADGKMDLLTVLMHELGHQIGLGDDIPGDKNADLMQGSLNAGERRLPVKQNLSR